MIILFIAVTPPAWAATFNVTKIADTNDGSCDADCSLREAIIAANASGGADTINVPSDTYTLSITGTGEDAAATGDLDITEDLTITGAGDSITVIDANGIDRVIDIQSGAGSVTITDIMLTNGVSDDDGGGIKNTGDSLTLNGVTISGNATPVNKNGGGIFNSSTPMFLTNVTISGNSAQNAGGIFNNSGDVSLTNVTITNNTASGTGGGVDPGSGVWTVTNTIIALNNGTPADCASSIGPGSNNLDNDSSCGFGLNTDPQLGPLQDNGGPTYTHALLAGSPAIDAGTITGAPVTDQRGVARGFDGDGTPDSPVVGDYDIGAYELPDNDPDITIDCDFSDWCEGEGTDYCVDDEGGDDDWTNPAKLDITRFGVSSNLSDSLFILFGYDDTVFPQAAQAATLIDTDLDDNIDYLVEAMVDGSGDTVKLYSCDDTLPTECGNPTLSQTYSSPGDYCRGTATGPWDTDTFVEVKVPYSHLGVSGGDILLTTMYSYNPGQFDNPKDSIYGTTEQDYDDRVQYDTGSGSGDDIPEAGTPSFAGTVYSDEGTTPIGAGTTVTLLVNGTEVGSDTTSVFGDYFIVAAASAGDAILVYVDDGAPYAGTTVSVFGGSNLSDLDIYDEHLITRHDNSGSLSIATMDTAKGGVTDSDILYDVSGGNLNVTGSGTELYIPGGHSFTPGGDVTTSGMKSLGTFAGGSGSIDINGTLSVNGGSFTSTSGTMSVSADFAHPAGTFTHNSGTVTLDGNGQSISGSTTFNHFTKSVAAAETLTFEAGSTQTFDGTVTLQGADSNLLALRSSSEGSQWGFTLNASATKALSYLDVQDSDASGSDDSQKFLNPGNSIDSCNNIDWFPWPKPQAGRTAALSPTRDTYIMKGSTSTNNGTCTTLTIDREDNDKQRALFYFNLSSIPAGAVITAATLELTASGSANMNVGVYRMTADWDEGSQCGATGQASWDDRQPSTPWGTAGGDYDGTAVDSVGSIVTGLNTWDVQSLVQDWVDGTYNNFGIMVGSPDGGGNQDVDFYSREDTTPANRPILRITYTEEGPYIFSAADQSFAVGDPATAISTITIADATAPTITAADDIRIRIPAGFNMTWDTADTTASICGGAAAKVSTTVSYEDSDKTLVIDVTTDFAASDYITISDLSFTSFTAASALDHLGLEVENDDLIQDTDDKYIFIIDDLSISSASYQVFGVGDPPTAISTITITDNSSNAFITAADDIRIRIPAGVYMLWDTSDTTATIGGGASSKVETDVSYEENGKVLVLDVNTDFTASDQITVSDLSFSDFNVPQDQIYLGMDVFNIGEAIVWDDQDRAIGGAPSAGSMLVYGESGAATPRFRTWDGLNMSVEASAQSADSSIKWVVLKSSPVEYEMIMGAYSTGTGRLYVQTWDGSNWSASWDTHLNAGGNYRLFDIAYEKNSGDAMVVFGNTNDNKLYYRKRVDGTWDGSDQLLMTPDNEVYWVRAESRPTNDDIFMATVSADATVYAMRWNGTTNSWGDQITTSAGLSDAKLEGFDLTFERASGDAFLLWGDGSLNLKYRQFTSAWDSSDTTAYTLPDNICWLVAAHDPQDTGSRFAIGMLLKNKTFEFDVWNGAGWEGRPTAIIGKTEKQRGIDVAFESDTGKAVYIFNQNATPTQMSWRTWDSAGGFGDVNTEIGATTADINFMQLQANRSGYDNEMMAVYVDNNADLYHRYWNGSIWTAMGAALETTISDADANEAFMFAWKESAATAVSLLSFTAQGQGSTVAVKWQTSREFDNLGFHLYRATSPAGPYERLTGKLISATVQPGKGGSYSYLDTQVNIGTLYYYKLEDIDIYGKHTQHGPICVDWDADGMPDDWEITHGLNPWVNDADLDYDGDGLSNFEEYERGLDPFNPDSDGDGIPDGQEDGRLPVQDDPGSRTISRGVEVLASDNSGMNLALNTSGFEAEVIKVNGQEYEQLNINDYVHGYTGRVGAPQMPLKGFLIDVPEGKAARLTVVENQVEPYEGYRIYPVPEAVVDAAGGMAAVGNSFYQDDLAYSSDGFYPNTIAALGQQYVFRDQLKQQLIFYPISFNPASGQLNLYRRIELRIDFVDAQYALASSQGQMPWQAPDVDPGVLAPIALGLAAAPALVNPISPLISSLGAAITALWSPPAGADGDVYKIFTDAEGIYHISKGWLDTNGVDTAAIRLSELRLYNLGAEVAIEVFDQNSDDQMDAQDFVRFYAQPVNATYTKYSDQNVYWLTFSGGTGTPLRMATVAATPSAGQLAADFADTAHHELNQIIWIKAPGEDSIERWFFWTYVQGDEHAGGGQPKAFTVTVPDPTSFGTLTILMAGQTETTHEVRVAINGVQQDFSWTGISYYQATLHNVPLVDGDNTVTLQCLSDDGNDSIIIDWFKIAYWRDYVAVADQLKFAPDSGSRYVIDGFSSNSLLAYDISNPADVAKIDNAVITGTGPYSIMYEPTVYGDTYLVLSTDTLNIPVELIQDRASSLADSTNGADYILITHRDVGWDGNGDQLLWLSDLVVHREAQGMRVFVADIEDIYDTFSYGIKSPHAVKDFLAFAYSNWTAPAARYVLLVGDATYDPKNHWNENDTTAYLPTYSIYTDYKGETVTDQWFVTFSGEDAVADMHIGRLPAADAAQAAVMVAKIIAYETAINTQTWQTDLLLIADNQRAGDAFAYEAAFETINEDAAALIPPAMADPFRGYLNDYAATAFLTDDIIDSINDGVLIANYAGHGATQVLAEEHIFDAGDVPALTNTDRLAFFVSMACEAGFFGYPETWFYPSLAEVLLRSDAGAVAALMPTGMTTTEGQKILNAALFEAIFTKDIRSLGPAIADAKQTLLANGDDYYEQIANTFLLFGDPATTLKIPLPHVPTGVVAQKEESAIRISWEAVVDCNDNPVVGYNIYRTNSAAGPFSKINIGLVTDIVFVDTKGVAGMADGDSYYAVSAVDNRGFESVQSLAVKPASTISSAGGSATGCFIRTATDPMPVSIGWMIGIIIGVFAVVIGVRCQCTGVSKNKSKTLNPESDKTINPFDELKQVKTLLVDDDEFIRNSLELAFKTKGCPLQVAQSAEEGLLAIKAQHFDIIISDLRLPGMNGLDFLNLTTVTHPNAIRFLITAYRDERLLSKAIRSGIDQFIDKPFAVNAFVNLLALALKRQTQKQVTRQENCKAGKLEGL